MEIIIPVTEHYLDIPVFPGSEPGLVCFYLEEEGRRKVFELLLPLPEEAEKIGEPAYLAQIPVEQFKGKTLCISGDFPQELAKWIKVSGKKETPSYPKPQIHFAADTGWTNDPNGMVFHDGLYHLYFQYNPFDIRWGNMSWGHAVSRDLLHWKQLDTVLFPDEDGVMFSGCGLVNEQGRLGLPRDTLLYFYSAAGGLSDWSREKPFVQKIAFSLDGGKTLEKVPDPCIGALCKDSRDPKVLWHEETGAYIMVLWLKDHDFGIFRSQDLKSWEKTQEITLEGGFECPDLFCLFSSDDHSYEKNKWFFWCADGYYFPGEFDGYRFTPDGVRRQAYLTPLPYAAQTFSGTGDRVISIPWLRMDNDGRPFTSAYGIPAELSLICRNGEAFLAQRPAAQLFSQLKPIEPVKSEQSKGLIRYVSSQEVLVISLELPDSSGPCCWDAGGSSIAYDPQSGILRADDEEFALTEKTGDLLMILDDRILEIFFGEGIQTASLALKERASGIILQTEESTKVHFYTIE